MGVSSLGYVILNVQDANGWAEFAQNVLGFGLGRRDDPHGALFLRMDEAPFRYMIQPAEQDLFFAGGYEMASKADYQAQIQKFQQAGIEVKTGSEKEARRRAVAEFSYCQDPSSNRVEIYHGRDAGTAFTPGHDIQGFKTGEMGLGHMVLPAPNNDATIDFYRQLMGFGVSDDLTLPPFAPDMPDQRIYFMHADNPRHHTLGLYNFPSPVGIVHLMAEVSSIDEVGACMDRVKQAGLHIFASLGRHANDEMISFYFFAPGGFGIEVGYDGKQVEDWSSYRPTQSTIGDLWGHEYDFPQVGEA